MKLMIRGHSPYSIIFQDNIVIKKSNHLDDNERLLNQKKKQEDFFFMNYDNIEVPEIYEDGYDSEGKYFFKMKHYNKHNFVKFFEISDKRNLDYFINIIIEFLLKNIQQSEIKDINKELIINKFLSITNNISKNKICVNNNYMIDDKIINKCIKNVKYLRYGINHGDLTLSNVLFDIYDRKIILIDFLDSFIDTPYNDIVKIRQDTNIKWSLNLVDFQYDFVKTNIILDYIDKIINEKIDIDNNLYLMFQYMNLLRVMQYVNDVNIFHFLKKEINKYEKFIDTSCG